MLSPIENLEFGNGPRSTVTPEKFFGPAPYVWADPAEQAEAAVRTAALEDSAELDFDAAVAYLEAAACLPYNLYRD